MTAQQVIKHFGTVTEAASVLGFTRQAIWLWKRHGIPRRTQEVIQARTHGKLKTDKR